MLLPSLIEKIHDELTSDHVLYKNLHHSITHTHYSLPKSLAQVSPHHPTVTSDHDDSEPHINQIDIFTAPPKIS